MLAAATIGTTNSAKMTAKMAGHFVRKSCIHEAFMISGPSQNDRTAVDVGFGGGGVTDKTISRPQPAADRNDQQCKFDRKFDRSILEKKLYS
jgi:hypothetical protein